MSKKTTNIRHKVHSHHVGIDEPPQRVYRDLIRQAVCVTLKYENVDLPCVVNVLIADDETIREYNKLHRGKNKATDVLSFPMQDFKQPGWHNIFNIDIDLDTGTVPLGDIIISTFTIRRNAGKHKVSFEQETTHMIIHSCLHLLGYDHGDIMKEKEKYLLTNMGY